MRDATPALPGARRQLTVVIGEQRYGLPGDSMVEVIRRPRITRVPHGPPALVGVANLRGTVLPVVSLARLMGEEPGPEARIAVLDHNGPVGLLVDAVLRLELGDEAGAARQLDFAALIEAGFKRPSVPARSARGFANAASTAAESHDVQRVLVAFLVHGQTFSLPLTSVIEVLRLPQELARVAHTDRAVLGIASIRDRSLPVISLGGVLGFGERQANPATDRVLIVEHEGARIGLVADAMESIIRLPETAIDKVPAILQRGRGDAELDAIGRPAGRPLVSILSVPKLFAKASIEANIAVVGQEKDAMVEQLAMGTQEQFVVFDLAGERYGLPIAAVDEVLRLPDQITRVPNGPRFVTGIINLRGRPIPIIDQRERFDAPAAEGLVQPRVIIVSFGALQAGFVVDAVSEILSVDSAAVAATPPLSSERAAVFSRIASTGPDAALVLLIDPQELLSRAEQDVIADIAARQAEAASR